MRKVMVSEYENLSIAPYWQLKQKGTATFHQFGVEYEELDGGVGNYTVAVVEWPDGTVESVPVNLIQFINQE